MGRVRGGAIIGTRYFAGMSLYSGFWNTYGVCAGGFEGEGGGGERIT
jgi:hypothetical protein